MAGELCGRGCGYCGRCDGQWEDALLETEGEPITNTVLPDPDDADVFCAYCEQFGCFGDCEAYYIAMDTYLESLSDAELTARADAFEWSIHPEEAA